MSGERVISLMQRSCAEAPSEVARSAAGRVDTAAEWRRPLTGMTLGLLLFETVTGLTIYLLPVSVFNQYGVLLHTVIGLAMLAPVGWYLGQHWWRRFRGNFNHYQLLGYVSLAALIVLVVSGAVLTWQALFGVRIVPLWDQIHVVATFVFVGVLGAHLLTLVLRRTNNLPARRTIRRAQAWCGLQTLGWGGAGMAVCGVLAASYRSEPLNDGFPSEYSLRYGADRPFAPSLARKDMSAVENAMKEKVLSVLDDKQRGHFVKNLAADPSKHVGIVSVAEKLCDEMDLSQEQHHVVFAAFTEAKSAFQHGGAMDSRHLAGSAGCGRSGCHSEITAEWTPSAHRYASMDFVFQKVQELMSHELAPEATRYCAGCHDPISLFSGAKNVGNLTLSVEGADEGVSCLACHCIVQTDVRGNADYTIAPPPRYIYEMRSEPWAQAVSDFLIRAYPQQHVSSYTRPLYKTAEFCGACHKQFVDEELNDFGWVQGQNQYDSWRKSRWHHQGDASKSIGCRECHMPLMASQDPAAGDGDDPKRDLNDRKHRGHRFLAANQYIPRYLKLEGAEEQCQLTVQWLRGEYAVPEIADRWTSGPVVQLRLSVPAQARPGEEVKIQTILTNNKAGHDFPTGPMDMIEGWVEVTVKDATDKIVFASARPDENDYLVNPQIVFKAELIDRFGEMIGRHNLWKMVGARFKRTLFPGFTDTTTFAFECPGQPSDPAKRAKIEPVSQQAFPLPENFEGNELRVSAVVWYCKFSAPFLDRLFGKEAGMRSEITDIARADAVIPVEHELAAK